jgi:hypothetical protein
MATAYDVLDNLYFTVCFFISSCRYHWRCSDCDQKNCLHLRSDDRPFADSNSKSNRHCSCNGSMADYDSGILPFYGRCGNCSTNLHRGLPLDKTPLPQAGHSYVNPAVSDTRSLKTPSPAGGSCRAQTIITG